MKCMSCEAVIDPKWRHSITANVCPFCGKEIMGEHLKNLLSSLSDVMDGLKDYSEQLDDYMLSNYNYIKTTSSQLENYVPKQATNSASPVINAMPSEKIMVKVGDTEQEVEVKKIQSDEKTNEFFRRAEAIKPKLDGFNSTAEKTKHFKNIIQQIKKSGTTVVDDNGDTSVIGPDMLVQDDPDSSQEIRSAIDMGNDEEIPAVVLAMAAGNKGDGTSNSADMIKLQQLRSRVKQSRENFESGASRGKGGFSRV